MRKPRRVSKSIENTDYVVEKALYLYSFENEEAQVWDYVTDPGVDLEDQIKGKQSKKDDE